MLLLFCLLSDLATVEKIAAETIPEDDVINHVSPPLYRVLISGSAGVGKTTLQQQFMTSEYLGNVDYLPGKTVCIIPNNAFILTSSVCGFRERGNGVRKAWEHMASEWPGSKRN